MALRLLRISILALLLQGVISGLHAQEVEVIPLKKKVIRLSYWTPNNGLPTWHIYEIIQDKRGLVWMGTNVGLVSMDGKKFQIHPVEGDAAIKQNIKRILIDRRQNLWLFCQTPQGQLAILIYNPFSGKTTTFKAYTGSDIGFSNKAAANLFEENDKIWILDTKIGIGGYVGPDCQWHETLRRPPSALPDQEIWYPAPNNLFWALNLEQKTIQLIDSVGGLQKKLTIPPNFVIGDYRTGTNREIYLTNKKNIPNDPRPQILCINLQQGATLVDRSTIGNLTFRSFSNFSFRPKPVWVNNAQGLNLNLSSDNVIDLFHQNELLYPNLNRHFHEKNIKAIESRLFVLPDGSFWIIGVGALIRMEVSNNYFTSCFSDLPEQPSTRGIVRHGDNLYVNSYSGLLETSLSTGKSRFITKGIGRGLTIKDQTIWQNHNQNNVSSFQLPQLSETAHPMDHQKKLGELCEIFVSSSGNIYSSSILNAVLFKKSNEKIFRRLPELIGKTFHENEKGIWLAGDHGVWLLDSTNRIVSQFKNEFSPRGYLPSINDIHEDHEGIFWMATNQGLIRWDQTKKTVKFFTQETAFFLNNTMYALLEDQQDRLWISSQNGLICFSKKNGAFRTFTFLDGLPANEFNYLSAYRDNDGQMYFGGINGVVSLNPDSVSTKSEFNTNIILTSVLFQTEQNPNQPYNLTYEAIFGHGPLFIPNNIDALEIRYCTPAFLQEEIRYRWRIPERDTNWRYQADPTLFLLGLPHGKYTLELGIVVPGNNVMLQSSLKLPLQVEPPLYLKPWFLALLAILILVVIYIATAIRQRQLLHLSRRLSKEVAEKTAQLRFERDIIAKQKETLVQLNEEKNRFFHDLSHEFRNPLTLILSPVNDLLKQENLPTENKTRLEQVRRNAKKILHLIEEVLELSKLEAGVVPVEKGPLPLLSFIQRICQDFESIAAQKNITLQLTHTLAEELVVLTDGRKLEKILINLIQNALKFTQSGGLIHVKAQWVQQGMLDIWVSDTGIGIAPEHLERIFERYYQIPSGSKQTSRGGFGIGLSLCRHYTTLLGGNIAVFSTPGTGTDLHITIPCKAAGEIITREYPRQGKFVLNDSPLILLIDDQAEMLEYIKGILAPTFRIVTSTSGEEALEILKKQQVDLIISDFMMEGMSGLDVLIWIRQDALLQHLPFVLLTGVNSAQFEERYLQYGINGVFSKPLQESIFLQSIIQLLSSKSTQQNHEA
ncbi:MAG TPA: ATP-binding protein [Saprospiraceae bacterium]|nr:ATP-binding protein [Saprospiraceae bacterium]